MDKAIAKKEITKLAKKIKKYNKAYFQEAKSLVSDYQYDKLLARLEKLEARFPLYKLPDSPTQYVGEPPLIYESPTAQHEYPMYSLSNTYQEEDVAQFIHRAKKKLPSQDIDFFCELKLDGVALSLIYRSGKLKQIITRGDGTRGDNITFKATLFQNLPTEIKVPHLPNQFEVRGEALMTKASFQQVNQRYQTRGQAPLANPRNATAGLLRNQKVDPKFQQIRPLFFYPYGLLQTTLAIRTQQEAIKTLKKWGFEVLPTHKHCQNLSEIMTYIHHWETQKKELPMMIDGIVIKVNSIQQQKALGHTAKSPRSAIAYKYKPDGIYTILEKITFQVGRTGVITPVACLQPISLEGTVIRRASLYNAQAMANLDLHIGDTILIEKGGGIIPKVLEVDPSKRKLQAQPITFITHCPECNTPLVHIEGEAMHYCPNTQTCPAQLKGAVVHFVSRKALNIHTIGPKLIDRLFEKKLIQKPTDLFKLRIENLLSLEGFREKSAHNVIKNIEQSKRRPFANVLFALGIRHVGHTTAKILTTHFPNVDTLLQASKETLLSIPEIGEKIANSLFHALQMPYYQKQIQALRKFGFTLGATNTQPQKQAYLADKTFVISGTFPNRNREEMQAYITSQGGRVLNSLSKKVHFLLIGHKPSPQKLKKAETLQIPVLREAVLQQMVGPS